MRFESKINKLQKRADGGWEGGGGRGFAPVTMVFEPFWPKNGCESQPVWSEVQNNGMGFSMEFTGWVWKCVSKI